MIKTKSSSDLGVDSRLKSGKPVVWYFSKTEMEKFFGDCDQLDALMQNPSFIWYNEPLSPEQWKEELVRLQPEVVVGAWALPQISDEILAECPSIRYLCYLCGSVRHKVSRGFIEKGGVVTNWGAIAADTVAECALMLILACLRQTTRFALEMHVEQTWRGQGQLPLTLYGRKVGVHGIGTVARKFARLLEPFGCDVEYWSEGVAPSVYEGYGMRRARGFEALFADNDIVVEVEGLTPQTEHSVTEAMLLQMRPQSVFVNVGRGRVLAPGAIEALAKRGDVAIGLDVYSVEPLPEDNILRGMKHVTLLPHTAGPTIDQYGVCRDSALNFLSDYIEGKTISAAITPAHYDRAT